MHTSLGTIEDAIKWARLAQRLEVWPLSNLKLGVSVRLTVDGNPYGFIALHRSEVLLITLEWLEHNQKSDTERRAS